MEACSKINELLLLYIDMKCAVRRDCKFSLNQTAPQMLEANLGAQGYWSLCSLECKQQFLKNWLHVHFEVAAQRFGEALFIGNVHSIPHAAPLHVSARCAIDYNCY